MSSHQSERDVSHTNSALSFPRITSMPVDTKRAREDVVLPHDINFVDWEISDSGPDEPRKTLKTYEESFDHIRCIRRSIYHAGILKKIGP